MEFIQWLQLVAVFGVVPAGLMLGHCINKVQGHNYKVEYNEFRAYLRAKYPR